MENVQEIKRDVKRQVDQICQRNINDLVDLWQDLFDPEIYVDHLKKLVDHVEAFYSDIINETKNRKDAILVQIKNLNQEKMELKRLLKEDVTDIQPDSTPLFTLQNQIDESLIHLREKLSVRRNQIEEYLLEQEQLCEEMDETPKQLKNDPLPSEQEMIEFRLHLDTLNEEKFRRMEEISNIRKSIKLFLQYLDIHILDDYDDALVNDRLLRPTVDNMGKLQHLHEQFSQQYEEMKYQIDVKRKKVESLWSYLSIDVAHRNKFAKYTEYNQNTYSAFSQELERCEQIKRENIKQIIEKVREEISDYWEKCLKSEQERKRFEPFSSKKYTEDLLDLHEMELQDLRNFYEENLDIFEMYKERNELWAKMKSLEEKASDPNRYNNRGGQLLKEEKERRMITTNLPKIETKLLDLVKKYDDMHKRPFTILGEKVQAIIDRDYELKKQEKMVKSTKKAANTPARTPLHSIRTPRTNDVTKNSAVRKQLQMPSMSGSKMLSATKMSATKMSAASSTLSSAASSASMMGANGKRKLVAAPNSVPRAKRTLIEAFNSPLPRTKMSKQSSSTSKLGLAQKSHTLLKRRSKSRKSVGKIKKSFQFKQPALPLVVIASSVDSSIQSDSISYELFENYVSENQSARSSIIHKPKSTLNIAHPSYGSPLYKKATPSKLRPLRSHNQQTPSPQRADGTSTTPNKSRKLTTKELPILF